MNKTNDKILVFRKDGSVKLKTNPSKVGFKPSMAKEFPNLFEDTKK